MDSVSTGHSVVLSNGHNGNGVKVGNGRAISNEHSTKRVHKIGNGRKITSKVRKVIKIKRNV